jgi:transposase
MEQTTVNTLERCVGLDLGDKTSAWCLVGPGGTLVSEGSLQTTHEGLERVFSSMPKTRIVMEATRSTHWVRKILQSFGHEVIVANPRRLDLITKSVRKTDRNDARILAQLGQSGLQLLSPVHERSDVTMRIRALLRARALLVRMRTKLVTHARGSVKTFGGALPSCSPACFHERARKAVPVPLELALRPLLEQLESLAGSIKGYDREIERLCKRTPQTLIFRDIHGVGPLVSLAFVTCIEDPKRFKDSRAVGAYMGLVPGSRQSGASNPTMRITKQGDGMLRTLLVTAATHILRKSAPDTDLKRYGRRIASSGTKRDKGRARIAVARKLACLMHRIWLTGEVYQPLRA